MRKSYKLFNLVFILFLFLPSCYNSRIPTEVINYIEHEDDNLCQLEGVEFANENTRLIYWKCRLRIINQRIAGEFDNYGYDLFYKREFKRLKRIIKNRIKEQEKIIIAEINNSVEQKEHNYCIMLKNNYQNIQDYDYFKCREDLEISRKDIIKRGLLDLNNKDAMELYGFIEKNDNKKSDSAIFVHSDCVKYVKNAKELEKCENAVKEVNKCKGDIQNKIVNRKIDDKLFCKKVSLKKYPDSLAKFSNTNSDTTSFGPKMEKLDIVNLRAKEYNKCYEERLSRIIKYRDYLEEQCEVQNLKTL